MTEEKGGRHRENRHARRSVRNIHRESVARTLRQPSSSGSGASIVKWSTTTTSSTAKPMGNCAAILLEDAARPFRFLDLACGDASATVSALQGTEIASYCGVDLSAEALDLARAALADLRRPRVASTRTTSSKRLRDWCEPVDVIWVGLSLHHLRAPRSLRRCAPPAGCSTGAGKLLALRKHEPERRGRASCSQRWDSPGARLSGLTPGKWRRIRAHVRTHDHPETVSRWRELGREAGFGTMQEHFAAPSNRIRLFSFSP